MLNMRKMTLTNFVHAVLVNGPLITLTFIYKWKLNKQLRIIVCM